MKSTILLILFSFLGIVSTSAQDEMKVKSFIQSLNDLSAKTVVRTDNSGQPCAMVKVIIAGKGVTFECGNLASMIVGNVDFHTNEYWVYLVAGQGGANHLKIKHPDFPTIDVKFKDFGFNTLESQTTYNLVINLPKAISKFDENMFYIQPFVQFGMFNGAGISIGLFVRNFNVEAFLTKGLNKSEEVFWISSDNTGSASSFSYEYESLKMGGKIGYGVPVGERFRLTPQIGSSVLSMKGVEVSVGEANPNAKNGYAIDLDISMRADFYLSKRLTIGLLPEYSIAINKSDLFERVASVSSIVDGFGAGFNSRIAVTFNF